MTNLDNRRAEQWRTVPGHPLYEVSDMGNARSYVPMGLRAHKMERESSPRPLRPVKRGPAGKDYYAITVTGRKSVKIHLIVLEAFIGPRPEGHHGAHENGNRFDNRLENLRWKTPGDNNRDKRRHGTDHQLAKTHCPRGHEYTPDNLYGNNPAHRVCAECSRQSGRERYARQPLQTECINGHDLTDPENVNVTSRGRKCKRCRSIRAQARQQGIGDWRTLL